MVREELNEWIAISPKNIAFFDKMADQGYLERIEPTKILIP